MYYMLCVMLRVRHVLYVSVLVAICVMRTGRSDIPEPPSKDKAKDQQTSVSGYCTGKQRNSGTADNGIQRISGAAVKRLWAGNPRVSESLFQRSGSENSG